MGSMNEARAIKKDSGQFDKRNKVVEIEWIGMGCTSVGP